RSTVVHVSPFFFHAPPPPHLYTLSLHDALPILTMLRILDGERMKLELFGNELELLAERVRDVEPAWVLAAELRELVGGPIDISKDRKSTRLNSSHVAISYAVFCLKKKKKQKQIQ